MMNRINNYQAGMKHASPVKDVTEGFSLLALCGIPAAGFARFTACFIRNCKMSVVESKKAELTALLSAAGRGEKRAFALVHAATAPTLLPYAVRIVKTRTLGEEVLQESFLAIWRDAGSFDPQRSAPMTWIRTIVRNKAVDCLRTNRLRDRFTDASWDGSGVEFYDPGPGPSEVLEMTQARTLIDACLLDLQALPRKAIELAFLEELSHGEVAQQMTLPLGTVKTWIRRGCQQMRKQVQRAYR